MRTKAAVDTIFSSYFNIVFSIISGLVLVPFYLKDFGTEVYGVWLATGNLIAWLSIMGGALSIVYAQNTAIAHSGSNTQDFRLVVGSGIVMFSLLAVFICLGVYLFADIFLGMFNFDIANYNTIKTALNISAIANSITIFHALFIFILGAWLQNEPVLYATIIGGTFGVSLNILLLYSGFGLLSIPLSMVGKSVVMLAILFFTVKQQWIKRKLQFPILRRKHMKIFIRSSGPILVSNLAGIGLNHSQSTIIGLLFGPSAATIVSVTDKLFSLVKTVIYPIGNAILQPLSSMLHIPSEFEIVSKKFIHQVDFLALSCILFCYIINQPFISLWLGSEYYGGDLTSVALAFSAYLIIRVNIMISVLNARGLFSITSCYTVLDLSIRIIILCAIYFLLKVKSIAILPLAECIGIMIATKLTLAKRLGVRTGDKNEMNGVFAIMICLGILSWKIPEYGNYYKVASICLAVLLMLYAFYEVWKTKILMQIINRVIAKK